MTNAGLGLPDQGEGRGEGGYPTSPAALNLRWKANVRTSRPFVSMSTLTASRDKGILSKATPLPHHFPIGQMLIHILQQGRRQDCRRLQPGRWCYPALGPRSPWWLLTLSFELQPDLRRASPLLLPNSGLSRKHRSRGDFGLCLAVVMVRL
jgi:hypothetical protein